MLGDIEEEKVGQIRRIESGKAERGGGSDQRSSRNANMHSKRCSALFAGLGCHELQLGLVAYFRLERKIERIVLCGRDRNFPGYGRSVGDVGKREVASTSLRFIASFAAKDADNMAEATSWQPLWPTSPESLAEAGQAPQQGTRATGNAGESKRPTSKLHGRRKPFFWKKKYRNCQYRQHPCGLELMLGRWCCSFGSDREMPEYLGVREV